MYIIYYIIKLYTHIHNITYTYTHTCNIDLRIRAEGLCCAYPTDPIARKYK